MTTKNPKGAGRPVSQEPRQRTQVSLTPALMAKFKELGASRWLAMIIRKEIEKQNIVQKDVDKHNI